MTSSDLQPMLLNVCGPCREGCAEPCEVTGCVFCDEFARMEGTPLTPARSRAEMIDDGRAVELRKNGWEPAGDLVIPPSAYESARARAEAVLVAAGAISPEEAERK